MKRLSSFLLLCLPLLAQAQTYDTIYNRAEECYYTQWYDTCECFLKGQRFRPLNMRTVESDPGSFAVTSAFTPDSMEVKGVMLFVRINVQNYHYGYRRPEYALLFQYDRASDSIIFLDSARWDTITPKIMKWPQGVDTAERGFYYCYAYPAYFDHPIMVDSTFYVGGTQKSAGGQLYKETLYDMMVTYPPCGCQGAVGKTWLNPGWRDIDYTNYIPRMDAIFGGFMPIVDKFRIDGEADNPLTGTVEGTGVFPNSRHTITAVPSEGYHFLRWNDGNTDNPRVVRLTQDTAFTAYFRENGLVSVLAKSQNELQGIVLGSSLYRQGTTATVTALPYDGFVFYHWDDGTTDNPREILVSQDTVLIAKFVQEVHGGPEVGGIEDVNPEALFTLSPNPTTGKVTVTVAAWGHTSVGHTPSPLRGTPSILEGESPHACPSVGVCIILRDAAGHEVIRKTLAPAQSSIILDLSKLPSGAYFVTLTTPTATATQRLVLK